MATEPPGSGRDRVARCRSPVATGLTTLGAMAIRPELRAELLALPATERGALADQLYDSLDDEPLDPGWEQAWSQELARRVADVAAGRVELIDAEQVHAELRTELRPAPR